MFCRALRLAAIALAACTATNPYYQGDGPPSPGDLTVGPDGGGECAVGQRACAQEASTFMSQTCVAGSWRDDRQCPKASICTAGYCQVPPANVLSQGTRCVTDGQCATNGPAYACQPFVTDPTTRRVELFCAYQMGTGNSGTYCTGPTDCRSGFCVPSTHTCYRACLSSFNCPSSSSFRTECRPVSLTVEGVMTTLTSCVIVQ